MSSKNAQKTQIIRDEVFRRQRLGIIPDSTAVRIDSIGAYEMVVKINAENNFDVEYVKNYFFTLDDLVMEHVESVTNLN